MILAKFSFLLMRSSRITRYRITEELMNEWVITSDKTSTKGSRIVAWD